MSSSTALGWQPRHPAPPQIEERCPDHVDMRLRFGFTVRLIEEPDGRKYSEHRGAWFCLARGCRYRWLEKG